MELLLSSSGLSKMTNWEDLWLNRLTLAFLANQGNEARYEPQFTVVIRTCFVHQNYLKTNRRDFKIMQVDKQLPSCQGLSSQRLGFFAWTKATKLILPCPEYFIFSLPPLREFLIKKKCFMPLLPRVANTKKGLNDMPFPQNRPAICA